MSSNSDLPSPILLTKSFDPLFRYVQFWEKRHSISSDSSRGPTHDLATSVPDTSLIDSEINRAKDEEHQTSLLLRVPDYSQLDMSFLLSPGKYKEVAYGPLDILTPTTAQDSTSPNILGTPIDYASPSASSTAGYQLSIPLLTSSAGEDQQSMRLATISPLDANPCVSNALSPSNPMFNLP